MVCCFVVLIVASVAWFVLWLIDLVGSRGV